jgi:hypothetical protein
MKNIIKTKSSQIASLINSGMESWIKAGEILVEMLDVDGLDLNAISQETGIAVGILGRFEQLGRKQMLPDLLIAKYPASQHIARLPYSEQERLTTESVEVLTADGKDKVLVAAKNLTPQQCRQVFSQSEVRDLAGQRAWIESAKRKTQSAAVESGMTYHIEKGYVVFDRGCTMKASQLLNILAQLTSNK